jgi:aldehyde:ferredoxin oxidoreductase
MPYGYHGRILHVDLTQRTVTVEEPPEAFYRTYFGGSALGLYYVLREVPPHTDALDKDNVLVLAGSVLTGAPISGQSRLTATAKSPLTGAIGDSQCGGFWPAELKFAGFEAVVIRGRASSPVYLWVHNGEAELRDAAQLWGKDTGDAEDMIRAELGDKNVEVVAIGRAGENLVRFACIMDMSNRAAGRTGMGAVMGSKNLKAVAVRGAMKPPLADPAALKELAQRGAKRFPEWDTYGLRIGSAGYVTYQQTVGGLPSFNWNSGVMEGALNISGDTMWETITRGAAEGKQDQLGRDTCYACVVRCKRVIERKEEPYPLDPHYGGPEYETMGGLGSYCGVNYLEAVAYANELCNRYGMDTISCGGSISWAMECFENGLIGPEDTGGVELKFGNHEAMVRMVKMIADREGFGAILAEGSVKAADRLGKGREYLVVVKGQELPAHMPQMKRGLGLIYAVNPFGADHQSSEGDPAYESAAYERYRDRLEPLGLTDPQGAFVLNQEKVKYTVITQRLFSFFDSADLCQYCFGGSYQLYKPVEAVDIVRAITGWDVTLDELLLVGERRLNMMRAFNAREGIGREADKLPDKLFEKPLAGGPTDGMKLDRAEYAEAIEEYYRQVGWDPETGNPTPGKLKDLGLDWVAV